MKLTIGLGLTLRLGDKSSNEFARPQVTYTDIDLDQDLLPQLKKGREAALATLEQQMDVLITKTALIASQELPPSLNQLFIEISNKLESLESGLIAVTEKVSSGKVRKTTKPA